MSQGRSNVHGDRVLDPSYSKHNELTKPELSSCYNSVNPSVQPVNSNIQTTSAYHEPINSQNQPENSIYQTMTSSIQSVNSSFQTVISNQEQERSNNQIANSNYQFENSNFQPENSIINNTLIETSKQNENMEKVSCYCCFFMKAFTIKKLIESGYCLFSIYYIKNIL